MKIIVEPLIAVELEKQVALTPNEFSGIGYCEQAGGDLVMYDFEYLANGSYGFTQIGADRMRELIQRPNADKGRIWVHRHPVGNGVPGPHNWSGTDNNTIEKSPLGGIPELVKWSASIVRTPQGWVGRIDNHITKQTIHVEVISELFGVINRTTKAAYDRGWADACFEMDRSDDQLAGIDPDSLDDDGYAEFTAQVWSSPAPSMFSKSKHAWEYMTPVEKKEVGKLQKKHGFSFKQALQKYFPKIKDTDGKEIPW